MTGTTLYSSKRHGDGSQQVNEEIYTPTVFSEQNPKLKRMNTLKRGFGFPPQNPPPRNPPPPPQQQQTNPKFPPTSPKISSAIESRISTAASLPPHTTAQIPPAGPSAGAPTEPSSDPNHTPSSTPTPNPPGDNNNNGTNPSSSNNVNNNEQNASSNSSGLSATPSTPKVANGAAGGSSPAALSYVPVQTLGPADANPTSSNNNNTTTSATQLSSQGAHISGGAIAAIVVGSLVVIGLLILVLYRGVTARKRQRPSSAIQGGEIDTDLTPMTHLQTPANNSISMIHSDSHQSPFHDSNTFPLPPSRQLHAYSSTLALTGHAPASSSSNAGGHSSFSSHNPVVSLSTARATEGGGAEAAMPEEFPIAYAVSTDDHDHHSQSHTHSDSVDPFHADDASSISSSSHHHHPFPSPIPAVPGATLRLNGSDASRYRSVEERKSLKSIGRTSSVVDPFHADDALSARVVEGTESLPMVVMQNETLRLNGSDASRYKELGRSRTHSQHSRADT